MILRRVSGTFEHVERLVIYEGSRAIMLAKLQSGEWVALNHWSEDPCNLRNREHRVAWALAQGLKVKDVEAYVRRRKREDEKEQLQEALDDAKATLERHGFTVSSPK